MTLAGPIPSPLPSGDAHATCPLRQGALATSRVSRCIVGATSIRPFDLFAPDLHAPQRPRINARSLPLGVSAACCLSIASSTPRRGPGSAKGWRCEFARGGGKMTPLSPSPASRASTVTPRSGEPAPASGSAYPSSPRSGSSVPIVCSCSTLTCSEASFAPDLGFARANLTYADAATGRAVWFVSPAEPLGQSDFLKSARSACASEIESADQSRWPAQRRFLDYQRVTGEPVRSHWMGIGATVASRCSA
ncbi:hypothetical protein AB7M56_006000 [Bradyrhizobium elkanii]|jgi:hypothetical protein|uniref:Uncharacterized protein n=1 Tax=Bradyrhizobium elkanii TaxID=29448 RepID=A0ABV4EU84_BRAEL|nr:hypothetical protein [Bradyrhizobium elkanii]